MNPNSHIAFDATPHLAQELPVEFTVPVSPEVEAQTQETTEAFTAQLNEFANDIPEVKDNQEAIQTAGGELIEAFGIKSELFDTPFRGLIFTSISARLAKLNEAGKTQQGGMQEKEFIADATLLLVRNFTDEFKDLRQGLEGEDNPNNLSEDGIEAIYDTYTDVEHSKAITEAIKNGLLDDVKAEMNVTDETEAPYNIRVLAVSSGSSDDFGMVTAYPEFPAGWTELPREEKMRLMDDASNYADSGRKWSNGLEKNAKEMRARLGKEETTAPAWVTTVNGEKQLCISLPLAEKILYREEVTSESQSYNDDDYARDLAILKHEWVHTQDGFIDSGLGIDFGISAEERRAEHFSGDKQGYGDVKRFFANIGLASGVSLREMFNNSEHKGREPAEILTALSNEFGVDKIVELMAVVPKNYAEEQSNPVRKNLHEYLGGFDGVVEKIYRDRIAKGEGADIQGRITQHVAELLERNYDFWSPEQYVAFQNMKGTAFLRKEIVAELTKQRKELFKDKIKTVNFN